MITWQHSDRYKIFTLTTCFFWRFVVTRGVTFGFWQIKLLGTDWAIFLSTLQLLTNCETCIGCSSSLLWHVHKYHLVILKHGWTYGEGGVLWPSNHLHCPLCLWASTCKHSLVCQQCWSLNTHTASRSSWVYYAIWMSPGSDCTLPKLCELHQACPRSGWCSVSRLSSAFGRFCWVPQAYPSSSFNKMTKRNITNIFSQ